MKESERTIVKNALSPSPACVPISRFDQLTPEDESHVKTCTRCEAELALYRGFESDAVAPDEGAAAAWIAAELQRRSHSAGQTEVRSSWWQNFLGWRLAVAGTTAVLFAVFAVSVFRSQSTPYAVHEQPVYRSATLQTLAPAGSLMQPPAELRWTTVTQAAMYEAAISEVDQTMVWRTRSKQTAVSVPPEIRKLMLPGKTLLWTVKALDNEDKVLVVSDTQKFWVKAATIPSGE